MAGGFRLFWSFSSLFIVAAAAYAGDDTKHLAAPPSAPPVAEIKPIIDMYHGTKVLDNYRWLEDGNSPETKKWVEGENAYTRGMLDRLAGRTAIHKRLTELLSIGSITPPVIAGHHYFYTKREGIQNQPILYVRDSLDWGPTGFWSTPTLSPPTAPSRSTGSSPAKTESTSPTAHRPAARR